MRWLATAGLVAAVFLGGCGAAEAGHQTTAVTEHQRPEVFSDPVPALDLDEYFEELKARHQQILTIWYAEDCWRTTPQIDGQVSLATADPVCETIARRFSATSQAIFAADLLLSESGSR